MTLVIMSRAIGAGSALMMLMLSMRMRVMSDVRARTLCIALSETALCRWFRKQLDAFLYDCIVDNRRVRLSIASSTTPCLRK